MRKKNNIQNLWLFPFTAHFLAIVAAYYTTMLIRFHSDWGVKFFTSLNIMLGVKKSGDLGGGLEDFYVVSAPRIVLFLTLSICLIYALRNLYSGRRFIRRRPVAWDIIVANVIAISFYYVYFYLSRNTFHPRSMFATLMFLNVIYCLILTSLMERFLQFIRGNFAVDRHSAILIGSNGDAEHINSLINILHPHGVSIGGRLDPEKEGSFGEVIKKMETMMRDNDMDMIIAAEKELSVDEIMQLLAVAEDLGVPVKILSDKLNILINQARIQSDMIHGVPLVHFNEVALTDPFKYVKQACSILSAYLLIVLFLPFILFVAGLIKLTSKGPVFFVQERIGVNRKPFMMYKFRTMYNKAEEDVAQMEEFNDSGDGLFKIKEDPRITPLGCFLRRFSLDELPQLINVIRNEMKIVGPRPLPRRDYNNYYEDWHYSRHAGIPGLTCLWQVSGRSDIDFHNMCILDVYYLRNRNWILDLNIILKTFIVVLSGKGAY